MWYISIDTIIIIFNKRTVDSDRNNRLCYRCRILVLSFDDIRCILVINLSPLERGKLSVYKIIISTKVDWCVLLLNFIFFWYSLNKCWIFNIKFNDIYLIFYTMNDIYQPDKFSTKKWLFYCSMYYIFD